MTTDTKTLPPLPELLKQTREHAIAQQRLDNSAYHTVVIALCDRVEALAAHPTEQAAPAAKVEKHVKTWPDRIYMVLDADSTNHDKRNLKYPRSADTHWCEDRLSGNDVAYVRADLADPNSAPPMQSAKPDAVAKCTDGGQCGAGGYCDACPLGKAAPSDTVDGPEFVALMNHWMDVEEGECRKGNAFRAIVAHIDQWHSAGVAAARQAKPLSQVAADWIEEAVEYVNTKMMSPSLEAEGRAILASQEKQA